MFESLSQWLGNTSLSLFFSDTTRLETWLIVPISQTVHILAVTVVMISVGMLNLRMLGVAGTRQTFPQLASQLIPWVWGALIALFITGLIQTIAEPGRELLNYGFRIKMVLLALSVAVTVFYEHSVRNDPNYWVYSPERQKLGRFLAISSLTMWVVIAALGRLIAYLDTRAVR
jgi:hypothetical protein